MTEEEAAQVADLRSAVSELRLSIGALRREMSALMSEAVERKNVEMRLVGLRSSAIAAGDVVELRPTKPVRLAAIS